MITAYKQEVDELLSTINVPDDVINCTSPCFEDHNTCMESLQSTIIPYSLQLKNNTPYTQPYSKHFSILQTESYVCKKILEILNENVLFESIFISTLLRIISSLSSLRLLMSGYKGVHSAYYLLLVSTCVAR